MYNEILSALETKLSDFATAQGVPVAWPAVEFTPTDKYLESFLLPAETGTGALAADGYQDYSGIFQINVVTKKNSGTAESRALTDLVLAEFSKASKAGNVLIEKSWASGSFDRENSYFVVPVSVRYRLLA